MRRHAVLLVTLAVLAAAIWVRIAEPGPLQSLRRMVFDAYLVLAPRTYDPALPVRIVDVDEASLARLGQWPWPRTRFAELVERLTASGAAVVAFDMILPETDRTSPGELLRHLPATPALAAAREELARLPGNDERLATAIGAAPVVLGVLAAAEPGAHVPPEPRAALAFAGDPPHAFVPRYGGLLVSLLPLVAAAKGLGAINWVPDHDQIVRRLPTLVAIDPTGNGRGGSDPGTNPMLYPTLAIEALRLAQGASTLVVRSSGASGAQAFGASTGVIAVRVGATTLPTDGEGQLALKLTHTDRRRFISAHRVLDGTVAADEIEGRIILIGASAPGLLDLRTTALDRAVPGVEIHAQAIEQILLGEHLVRPDYAAGLELTVLAVFGGLLAWWVARTGARGGAIGGLLGLATVLAGSWLAYRGAGLLIDPVMPAVTVGAVYMAGTLVRFLGTERERAQIRGAFSRYMAPALVEQLAADPSRLRLGGETRDVSILFLDVRGFTSLSEGMDAQALTRFVNRLFTPLSDVILSHRGTIDKYMGDAVMAFWNAPLDDPEHARNAARAALAMLAELERLNTRWAEEARAKGRAFSPVAVGIGIDTGECVVGNLGSEQRFDYSVIGDHVNLASRLEGLTKTYRVGIIVGEQTAAALGGMALIEIGAVPVRGKAQPVRIHALLGDEQRAAEPAFRRLAEAHAELTAAERAGDDEVHATALARCRAEAYPGLEGLYEALAQGGGAPIARA
jgi:adenylate cyclase